MNGFITEPSAVLSVGGIAFVCALVGLWLKQYLPDWRLTNLLVLVIGLVISVIALLVTVPQAPSGEQYFGAIMTGLIGASIATFGYETISNLLGLLGAGPRSDPALDAQAERRIDERGGD